MRYRLEEISKVTGGIIAGKKDNLISSVIIDSRTFSQAGDSLFIALEGPNHDGHHFIGDMYRRGVKSFLVRDTYLLPEKLEGAGFIRVADTLEALQRFASFHRDSFRGEVIGITGSNGKTIVKEWLAQIIDGSSTVSRNPKSFNSQVGVPLSVLMMDDGPDYHLLEAGISRPGEMGKLEKIIQPDIGIITNIGDAHQENFDSLVSKLTEKLALFRNSRVIIYNADDELVRHGVESMYTGQDKVLLSWSFSNPASLRIFRSSVANGTTTLSGEYNGRAIELKIPFTDKASIQNILHIWLACCYLGIPDTIIEKGVSELEPVAMRLEQKEGINGCTLINDFYNADLHSLSIAFDLLINQLPQKKKSIIISELLQTGLDKDELINQLNNLIGHKGLHRIIGIGPLFTENRHKFRIKLQAFQDTGSFLEKFDFSDFHNEAILLKGARLYAFERISSRLEKRVHNTFVEINMNNLLHNLNYFRTKVSRDTKIMAMVKAASYGSGTYEIGKFLAHQRIDYLGVAFADEGVALREAGIDTPIMVMNPGLNSLNTLVDFHLEPEIYSLTALKEFMRVVERAGVRDYPVHIKIDTGMHRLGLQPDEADEVISLLDRQNILKIASVFSHLSSADNPDGDSFTVKQADVFEKVCERIKSCGRHEFICHLANTAGILRFPEYHYDMVRLGIGLYGIGYQGNEELLPVLGLKSIITQIHNLKKGEPVGYGNSELMKQDGKIAVVPVGYADGIDRRLGNGLGKFIIKGHKIPTIGRICMDMCMLDISSIDASVGDQVVVIGEGADIEEMSEQLNTIPYEILSRIPQRVKRVYLFE